MLLLIFYSVQKLNLYWHIQHKCSISVTRREQQETNWCWAAVSQMIGAHYYGLLTQRQIVINVLGAEYNQGASDAQVRQAIAFAINNKYNVTTRNSLSYERYKNIFQHRN